MRPAARPWSTGKRATSISFQLTLYRLLGTQRLEFLPSMNDRIGIDFLDAFQNSVAKFLPGLHPKATEEGASHLPEERLDDVEPGAMRGRQHVFEPVWPRRQICACLLGDMRRMIVEDDPNGAGCRIVSIQIFEQRDELAAPVTPLDPSNDVAIMEIQCSQNRACSQTLVFMVACRGGMFTGHRRQVWRGIGNGL